jgi:hypothetical protein
LKHVIHRVFYQMKLAALMRHAPETGRAGRAQSGMIITRDQTDTVKAPLLEEFEEGAPMNFGFTQGATCTENGAVSVFVDADGDEDCAIA